MSTTIYMHNACLHHSPGATHPEHPQRIEAVLDALQHSAFAPALLFHDAPMARERDILHVHPKAHLERIKHAAPASGTVILDGDTVMSAGSLEAAYRAAGAGCAAVDKVMSSRNKTAFCLTRPPGHHASADRAMGFCFFNNVAIAARYALTKYKLKRVSIVDFDVHHGNGTQDIFLYDDRVQYISTHQSPLFPGTGKRSETGNGNILNVELPQHTSGATYRQHFTDEALPALAAFKPKLLLISAGFDAHKDDPLASMGLVEDDFAWIGTQLRAFAKKHTQGRTVSVLEGGYNPQALARSVTAYLQALTEA